MNIYEAYNIVKTNLPHAELLLAFAEELSELQKALLKYRRVITKVHYTPVTLDTALANLTEEIADVLCCAWVLGIVPAKPEYEIGVISDESLVSLFYASTELAEEVSFSYLVGMTVHIKKCRSLFNYLNDGFHRLYATVINEDDVRKIFIAKMKRWAKRLTCNRAKVN